MVALALAPSSSLPTVMTRPDKIDRMAEGEMLS